MNFSRNINDEAAKSEKDYYDSIGPDIQEIYNRFDQAVDTSQFKADLTEKWGATFLKKIEMELKTFDPKIMDMLRKETELRNEYTKLTAGAKIEFDGKSYNLAGLGPFHTHEDRGLRKSVEAVDCADDDRRGLLSGCVVDVGDEASPQVGRMGVCPP